MRRIFGLLLLASLVCSTGPAFAAEQIGVYVAPKFVYGLTKMDNVKLHGNMGGTSDSIRIGDKSDDTFGGSLAIGYDFEKRFGVPIRAELILHHGVADLHSGSVWADSKPNESLRNLNRAAICMKFLCTFITAEPVRIAKLV